MFIILVEALPKLLHCTFAVGCAVDATHPPVKVLLTDGLDQGLVCPVEQVLFIHSFPSIPLLHLLFLPEHTI